MLDLVIIGVKLIDPVSFLLALVLVLPFVHRYWQCVLVGLAVALVTEAGLWLMQYDRTFGLMLIHGAIASTAHAALALAIKRRYRQRRLVLAGVVAGAVVLTIIPAAIGFVGALP